MPRLTRFLMLVAAMLAVAGVSSVMSAPGVAVASHAGPADEDHDGVPDAEDICQGYRGENPPPAPEGKLGCGAFFWTGSAANGSGNLGTVVDQGFIQLATFCNPDVCRTIVTLSAGKRARKQLGLKKALIGRKVVNQKLKVRGDDVHVDTAFADFDLPRKVVQKMDGLDQVKLQAKFEVSAPDTPRMKQLRFTESGTINLTRQRSTAQRPDPPGQGLRLFRGTCPSDSDCTETNAD